MNAFLKPGLMFAGGVAATLGLVALLGADNPPAAQPKPLDTQIVPIAGGMALVLSIHDRENNRLFLYQFPTRKDERVRLRGNIDLSATGKEELPAELKLD